LSEEMTVIDTLLVHYDMVIEEYK